MSSRKFGLNLVVVLAIAALFTGFWALINRPVSAPAWPEQISGFSYSPFRLGQSPQKGQYPSEDEIRQDLEQLNKLTRQHPYLYRRRYPGRSPSPGRRAWLARHLGDLDQQ